MSLKIIFIMHPCVIGLKKILQMNYIGKLIRFIAALTLEINLVGFVLCITSLNDIFPFNIIIVF